MKKIKLPDNVKEIIKIFNRNNFECYVVGGFVRDSLMGIKTSGDIDFCTNATPEEVCNLFSKTILTGLKHGTVTIVHNDEMFEVTTYRTEGKYSDSRHPDTVEFVKTIEEDLNRRDFTINAIAYDGRKYKFPSLSSKKQCMQDIKMRVIRCVGNPNERFNEDPLRILRAIRFEARVDNEDVAFIESETHAAMNNIENVNKLEKISKERIRDEFFKIAQYYNNTQNFYKMFDYHHIFKKAIKSFPSVKRICYNYYNGINNDIPTDIQFIGMMVYLFKLSPDNKEAYMRFKMFFKELKFPNKIIQIAEFIYTHIRLHNGYKELNYLYKDIREKCLEDFEDDIVSCILSINECLNTTDFFMHQHFIKRKSNYAICYKDLDINGTEIQNLGFNGKLIGECYEFLLNAVIEGYVKNNNQALKQYIRKYFEIPE